MANWRKQDQKFEQYLKKKAARDAAKSPEQRKQEEEAFFAKYGFEQSNDEEADEFLAEHRHSRLVQALADAIRSGGLPCCNRCFAPVVLDIQDQQQKLRVRYGASWHGRVKFKALIDGRDERAKSRAWDTVRWLEERNFVTVGNGHITWRS